MVSERLILTKPTCNYDRGKSVRSSSSAIVQIVPDALPYLWTSLAAIFRMFYKCTHVIVLHFLYMCVCVWLTHCAINENVSVGMHCSARVKVRTTVLVNDVSRRVINCSPCMCLLDLFQTQKSLQSTGVNNSRIASKHKHPLIVKINTNIYSFNRLLCLSGLHIYVF